MAEKPTSAPTPPYPYSRHGTNKWHRGSVEEDTRCPCWEDTHDRQVRAGAKQLCLQLLQLGGNWPQLHSWLPRLLARRCRGHPFRLLRYIYLCRVGRDQVQSSPGRCSWPLVSSSSCKTLFLNFVILTQIDPVSLHLQRRLPTLAYRARRDHPQEKPQVSPHESLSALLHFRLLQDVLPIRLVGSISVDRDVSETHLLRIP